MVLCIWIAGYFGMVVYRNPAFARKFIRSPRLMKQVFILLLSTFCVFQLKAQKVFSVDYASQADVKVYVVKYESQADLKVFKVNYESQVGQNDGKWFFVKYVNQADKKIYFVDYESQADVKLFFVQYQSQAGWRNASKRHFFY
jgi:hypothetical protein